MPNPYLDSPILDSSGKPLPPASGGNPEATNPALREPDAARTVTVTVPENAMIYAGPGAMPFRSGDTLQLPHEHAAAITAASHVASQEADRADMLKAANAAAESPHPPAPGTPSEPPAPPPATAVTADGRKLDTSIPAEGATPAGAIPSAPEANRTENAAS